MPGAYTEADLDLEQNLAQVHYATLPEDFSEVQWDDVQPVHFTTDMDAYLDNLDDTDTVMVYDGEKLHALTKPGSAADVLTAYKRVDRKVKPVPAVFPEEARVTRQFPEDPLKSLPELTPCPPDFKPDGGRLT